MEDGPEGASSGTIYGTLWQMDNEDDLVVDASLIMRMQTWEDQNEHRKLRQW